MSDRVPSFNLFRINSLRRQLTDEVLLGDVGCTFSQETFKDLVARITAALPEGISETTVAMSIAEVAAQPLTTAAAEGLAWRLAANVGRLKAGVAVPVWARQPEDEWVPFQVEDVVRVTRTYGRGPDAKLARGVQVKLRALAGYPAGRLIEKFWSSSLVSHYKAELGFAKYDRQKYQYSVAPGRVSLPLHDSTEVGQFRFVALVTAAASQGEPGFKDDSIRCTATNREWNQTIMRKRHRVAFACPIGVTTPCFRCQVGWDECEAACHPRTFETRPCAACGDDTPHDPEYGCVLCAARATKH